MIPETGAGLAIQVQRRGTVRDYRNRHHRTEALVTLRIRERFAQRPTPEDVLQGVEISKTRRRRKTTCEEGLAALSEGHFDEPERLGGGLPTLFDF
jgi:hypothetical protein